MTQVKRCLNFFDPPDVQPPQPPVPRDPIQIISDRIYSVEGHEGKCNDVLFTGFPDKAKYNVIFFHGDITNYTELMCTDRDCQKFQADFNLEELSRLLMKRFNENHYPSHIWSIRVNKYMDHKYVVWSNFLEMNNEGQPNFNDMCIPNRFTNITALPQLEAILNNAVCLENERLKSRFGEICTTNLPIILVGFSKGCCVLTKILYEFNHLIVETGCHLGVVAYPKCEGGPVFPPLVTLVRDMYWLDSGHNGEQELWPHDFVLFDRIRQCGIKSGPGSSFRHLAFHAYATPFQIGRPIKLRSCQEFGRLSEILQRLGVQHSSGYLLRGDEINLQTHFDILKSFPIKRR